MTLKILLANPNMSADVTARMMTVAEAVAAKGTEIDAITAPSGFPYISSRAEAAVAGGILLDMLCRDAPGHDAIIVAAFGDPALAGARELFDVPVVGLAESAMVTALMLGRRFAIVTFSSQLQPWYEEIVASYGLEQRCAGVFCATGRFTAVGMVAEEMLAALEETSRRAIAAGADCLIFGGAPIAGVAALLRDKLDVPCVDPVIAAVKQAETLVAINPRKPLVGPYRRPIGKSSVGLSDELADRIAGR